MLRSTEAVAIDVGLGGFDGVVVDVARNEGPGRMEAKGEERKDAAGAHPDVDADGVLRDTKLARMRYRALERAGQKIFDPVDVICTLWYRRAEKSFGKLPVKVEIMSEQCLSQCKGCIRVPPINATRWRASILPSIDVSAEVRVQGSKLLEIWRIHAILVSGMHF